MTKAIKDAATQAAAVVTVDEVKRHALSPTAVAMGCGFVTGAIVFMLMSRGDND